MSKQAANLKKLAKQYRRCRACGLHEYRRLVVCGSGDLNALVMFIGEGPGKSEDLLGEPFAGPSGRVLRRAIEAASDLVDPSLSESERKFFFTNVVACRPCNSRTDPNRQPTDDEAWACMERVEKLDQIVRPKLIVLLGLVPERLLKHLFPGAGRMSHPASILRSGGLESSLYDGYVRDMSQYLALARRIKRRRTQD